MKVVCGNKICHRNANCSWHIWLWVTHKKGNPQAMKQQRHAHLGIDCQFHATENKVFSRRVLKNFCLFYKPWTSIKIKEMGERCPHCKGIGEYNSFLINLDTSILKCSIKHAASKAGEVLIPDKRSTHKRCEMWNGDLGISGCCACVYYTVYKLLSGPMLVNYCDTFSSDNCF